MNIELASPRSIARGAGFLYLLIAIFGAFPEKYVREFLIVVQGDAAATAANIVANEGIFRFALVSDLIMMVSYALLAMTLFALFVRVDKGMASLMMMFNLVGVGILCLNMLNHYAALEVALRPEYLNVFSAEQLDAFALFFLRLHDKGYVIAQVSTGTWLLPLGWLVYKSGFMPKLIGILLIAAGASYLVDLFAQFLLPSYTSATEEIVLIPAIIGELSFLLYLLIKGVKQKSVS